MKSPISIICASALMAAVSIGEVTAAPLSLNLPATASGGSDVVQVRDNVRWPRMHRGGQWNGNGRNWQNGRNWKHSPTWRPGWGYRNGWNNYYNDGWYGGSGIYLGGGALLLGALVGSALANNNYRGAYAGNSHVQWCANRYRSYSPRSDTYQPYNGPRRRCISPY